MDLFGPNSLYYLQVLALGALAGFTIYLGIPLAFYRGSQRARAFLVATSVGVLLFLFVEITYLLVESVETQIQLAASSIEEGQGLWWRILILVSGFTLGLLGLQVFEAKFMKRRAPRPAEPPTPRRLALLIAAGIGLHNFSEGLVIGQSFISGSLALGYTLAIGFALHNATEGFGIAAPIAGTRPHWGFLAVAGIVAGGPTFIGTLVGVSYTSAPLEALCSALAAGAILYIVSELFLMGRRQGGPMTVGAGILVGFFLAFGSDLVVQRAMAPDLSSHAALREVRLEAGDYFFRPNRLDLTAGEPVALVLTNSGSVDHEIDIIGLGARVERRVHSGRQTTLILTPRHAGRALFICDMPGHLSGGMWGRIVIHEALPAPEAPPAAAAAPPAAPSGWRTALHRPQ